jgi:8-oxo-dGTP pyrophosphatase MutT (NUDIX family)
MLGENLSSNRCAVKIIDKLAWIYVRDRRLLAVRSYGKQRFYIPGGKRDPGETDHQALIRETKEELNVDLIQSSIEPALKFTTQADEKTAGTQLTMTCYYADYSGTLSIASEIEEMAWLSTSDIARCSLAAGRVMEHLHAKKWLD